MPALEMADVAVVVQRRTLSAGQYRANGEITFGDGVKTYPTGGIPLPTSDAFGCPHEIETLQLGSTVGTPPPTLQPPILTRSNDGRYTLQLFKPGTAAMEELASTVVPEEQSYRFTAIGT